MTTRTYIRYIPSNLIERDYTKAHTLELFLCEYDPTIILNTSIH